MPQFRQNIFSPTATYRRHIICRFINAHPSDWQAYRDTHNIDIPPNPPLPNYMHTYYICTHTNTEHNNNQEKSTMQSIQLVCAIRLRNWWYNASSLPCCSAHRRRHDVLSLSSFVWRRWSLSSRLCRASARKIHWFRNLFASFYSPKPLHVTRLTKTSSYLYMYLVPSMPRVYVQLLQHTLCCDECSAAHTPAILDAQ